MLLLLLLLWPFLQFSIRDVGRYRSLVTDSSCCPTLAVLIREQQHRRNWSKGRRTSHNKDLIDFICAPSIHPAEVIYSITELS